MKIEIINGRFECEFFPMGADQAYKFDKIESLIEWTRNEEKNWKSVWGFGGGSYGNFSGVRAHETILRELSRELQDFNGSIEVNKTLITSYSEDGISKLSRALEKTEAAPYLCSSGLLWYRLREANYENDQVAGLIEYLNGKKLKLSDIEERYRNISDFIRMVNLSSCLFIGRESDVSRLREQVSYSIKSSDSLIKNVVDAHRNKLEATSREMESLVDRLREKLKDCSVLFDKNKTDLSSLLGDSKSLLTNLHDEKKNLLDDIANKAMEEYESITATFEHHMSLKAPTEYWKSKSVRHRWSARFWMVFLVVLIVAGIVSVILYHHEILNSLGTGATSPIGAIAVWAFPALLYATIVRTAHRSFRDEARHADDADLRSTLVQTYLALTHKDAGNIQGGERLLALHALFRGSAQTNDPDDTPPINALEALLQTLKPKSGG